MPIQLQVTTRGVGEASAALRALLARCQDLRPVLKQIGVHLLGSINRNFEVGGRPAWPPSIRALTRGGQTLIDKGVLKNSIQSRGIRYVGPRAITLGTNVRYAGAHQFGFQGTVQIPEHIRRVRSRDIFGMERRVSKKTGKAYMAKVRIATGFAVVKAHSAQLRIPPRPFLVVQDEDYPIMEDMLGRYLDRGV